ncbi:MAG TPA: hypothetical protein VG269_16690 [Tepidisphaeraceae bacterium]|jgi:hypothetical protein|nr:hypothetical protein [Tepidisphaeraceae bacterium]
MSKLEDDVLREVHGRLTRRMAPIAAAMGLAFIWGLYFLREFAGFDFVAWLKNQEPVPPVVYLIVAILGTIIIVIVTARELRTSSALALGGKYVDGKVIRVGLLSSRGMTPVTVSYVVDGTGYKKRTDMLKGKSVGDSVRVLYDPKNPRTCQVF